jgi:hypothetical protein
VSVTLPEVLLALFPGAAQRVAVVAATMSEAMDALDARWPGIHDRLCASRPAIRRHINVVRGRRARRVGDAPARWR